MSREVSLLGEGALEGADAKKLGTYDRECEDMRVQRMARRAGSERNPMMERSQSRLERGTRLDRLWREDRVLLRLLEDSESVEDARDAVLGYLDEHEAKLRAGLFDLDRTDLSFAVAMTTTLKNLFSPESEAVAGCSTLASLMACVEVPDDEISAGFVEEMIHMLRAMHGRAHVGRGWYGETLGPSQGRDDLPRSGRRGGVIRSEYLDRLAEAMETRVRRFPSGLDPHMVARRMENRRRVLAVLEGTEAEWEDPAWQMANVLRGLDGVNKLQKIVPLKGEEIASVRLAVRYGVPWGITPYYLSLFDFETADRREDGQVRSQVIPPIHTVRAMIEHRGDRARSFDFMREGDTSPIAGVTRRYPRVAILKVCDTCPQICTYCQRNWEISDAMDLSHAPTMASLEPALRWFETHKAVSDVLLTGGDPFILDDELLSGLIDRFSRMDHVRNLRFGTRVPVTMPTRITEELADRLAEAVEPGQRTLSVSTHVESAYEVTPELVTAIGRLRKRGISVYNQQVFTVETSRRFQTVANRLALKRAGIDPYYVFYTKGKDEHRDYLVPIARLAQERKEEARLLPGVFRTDESVFNVPGLGKNHLRASQDRELVAVQPDGRRVYLFHPWEKGIAPVSPWVYSDVPIYDYLSRMVSLGERAEDYESIWYYI